VLLCHGFTGDPRSTRPLARHLDDAGFAVVALRLPGHGTSVRDLAGTRYADWVRHVEDVTDELLARCDAVVLLGLGSGGTLVLDVAGRRDVVGVVTVNAPVLDRDHALARLPPLLRHVVPAVPRGLVGRPAGDVARPGVGEHAERRVPARAAHSLERAIPRVRAQLGRVTAPALVAWSPQDHTVAPDNAAAILAGLASDDVTEVVLERSYHVATLDWDAELLADAVVAFVARVSGT
jgi:carboxylesterase